MGFKTLINKFTAGEIDPKFLGQVDYDGYRKGARKLRNSLCIPQGAQQRRFGTVYERTIMDGATPVTDPDIVKLIAFEYLTTEQYWMILRPNVGGGIAVDIYLDNAAGEGVFQQTVDPLGAYTPAQINDIRWVADINKLIFFHESHIPLLLQRVAANNWISNNAVFTYYPAEDFSTQDNPLNNYQNNGTTFTPNLVAATTITASTAVFTSNHAGIAPNAGGLFIGHGGIFRIVSVDATGTVATGFTTNDFDDTSAIRGADAFLGERAWGDGAVVGAAPAGIARGYPRHGAFFQSRLCLGGSLASPGTVYASDVKDYFSFDTSEVDPAAAWTTEAGISGTDKIQDIVSTKALVLLTNRGSSATNILVDAPTTATNVFLNSQGQEPSRNMDAVVLNNQVLFADFGGNTIWSMVYDVPDSGYTINNASIISAHLIRNPQWADVYDPSSIDGRYYLLINIDGTMAILNSILEENINAWSLAETIGGFIDVACVANKAKVLTRRQVNTGGSIGGLAQALYTVDSTFNVFRNIKALLETPTPQTIMLHDGDYILIGNEIPFTRIALSFSTPASQSINPIYQFLTDTGEWETFIPAADGTAGFTQNGAAIWSFSDLSNWKSQVIPETDKIYGDDPVYYWIRIKRNEPAAITVPILQSLMINTQNRIHLEILAFDSYMDATYETTSNAVGLVTGLDFLAGQKVFVFVNDFPVQEFYVESDGTMLLDYANADIAFANANVTLGLFSIPYVVPMPVVTILQNGISVYDPEQIKSVYLDYFESLGLTVQGQNIPQVVPGQFLTDKVPQPESGYTEVPGAFGWDPRVEVVISQSYPAPMVIRGISYDVEVSS